MQVCDTFLGNDMSQVIAVDHNRFNRQISVFSQSKSIQFLYEARRQFFTEGFGQLYDQAFAAVYRSPHCFFNAIFFTAFKPCFGRMTTAFRVAAHIWSAAEACHTVSRSCRTVAIRIDLQCAADKHINSIMSCRLRKSTV